VKVAVTRDELLTNPAIREFESRTGATLCGDGFVTDRGMLVTEWDMSTAWTPFHAAANEMDRRGCMENRMDKVLAFGTAGMLA